MKDVLLIVFRDLARPAGSIELTPLFRPGRRPLEQRQPEITPDHIQHVPFMFGHDDYNNDGRANNIKQHTQTTIFVSIVLLILLLCRIQGGFCDGTFACVLRVFSMPFDPPPLMLLPLLLILFNEFPPPPPPVVVVIPDPL